MTITALSEHQQQPSFEMDLQYLIGPIAMETFLQDYWETQPLLVNRDHADHFAGLMSFADLDRFLGYLPDSKKIQLILENADGPGTPREQAVGLANLGNIYDQFYKGHRLRVEDVHLVWEPLAKLHLQLAHELQIEAVSSLNVMPPQSPDSSAQWQDRDVFLLQLSGAHQWNLFDGGPLLPRTRSPRSGWWQDSQVTGKAFDTVLLKPGDCLYLPRGLRYQAHTGNAASMYVAVHIVTRTWEHLLMAAITRVSENQKALRHALPIGWQNDRGFLAAGKPQMVKALRGLLEPAIVEKARRLIAVDYLESLAAVPDGMFPVVCQLDHLQLDTPLERRSGELLMVHREAQLVKLFFPGQFQGGPEKLEWAFDFMAQTPRFSPGEIPGWYSSQEKLTLVKYLVRKGFLKIAHNN